LKENADSLGQSKVKESKVKESKEDICSEPEPDSEPDIKKIKYKINFNREKWKFEDITEKDVEIWQEAYPAANLEIELNKMIAWIKEAGSKGYKSNWGSFINRWLKRCQDSGGTKEGVKDERSYGNNRTYQRHY